MLTVTVVLLRQQETVIVPHFARWLFSHHAMENAI